FSSQEKKATIQCALGQIEGVTVYGQIKDPILANSAFHSVANRCFSILGAKVERVVVRKFDLVKNTLDCELVLADVGREHEIECAIYDGYCIALAANCAFFVSEAALKEYANRQQKRDMPN